MTKRTKDNLVVLLWIVLSFVAVFLVHGCAERNSKGPAHQASYRPSFALTIANVDSYAWSYTVVTLTHNPALGTAYYNLPAPTIAAVGTLAPGKEVTLFLQRAPDRILVRQGDANFPGGFTDHSRWKGSDYQHSLRIVFTP